MTEPKHVGLPPTAPWGNTTIQVNPPSQLKITTPNGETLLTIHHDGRWEFRDEAAPTEAARVFVNAVRELTNNGDRQAIYRRVESALIRARAADANPEGPDFVTALGDILLPAHVVKQEPVGYQLLALNMDLVCETMAEREYVFMEGKDSFVCEEAGAGWLKKFPQDIVMVVEVYEK